MVIKLNALASKLSQIPTSEIDEAVAAASSGWAADWRSLQVMLSSPLKRLEKERNAIRDALRPFSQLDTQLFAPRHMTLTTTSGDPAAAGYISAPRYRQLAIRHADALIQNIHCGAPRRYTNSTP